MDGSAVWIWASKRVGRRIVLRRRATVGLAIATAALASAGLGAPVGATAAEPGCGAAPSGSIYFNGTLSEGTLKIGPNASASGISGTVTCGLLSLTTDHFSIPAENVRYNPFQLKIVGLLPFETTITLDGAASGGLIEVARENEVGELEFVGYNSSFTAPVTSTVTTSVLGLGLSKCNDGPITPTLTTGRSGSLEGTLLKGSAATSLEGTLVANEFVVPAIGESATCPGAVALLSNTAIGLPRASGESSLTTKAFLKTE
jgi:hypothetical protein